MTRTRIAKTAMIGIVTVGLTSGMRPPPPSGCLHPTYDLIAGMAGGSENIQVVFTNRGQQPAPAFGYKLAIYRWMTGNKAYSTTPITINFAGSVDSNVVPVGATDCYSTTRHFFSLGEVRRQYSGQRVQVRIIYDRVMRDADNSNHNPQMTFTL